MSEKKQIDYGEPWVSAADLIVDCSDTLLGQFYLDNSDKADRAVSCVNALAGVEDPVAYERAAILQVRNAINNVLSGYIDVLDDWYKQQLEAALAALTPKH